MGTPCVLLLTCTNKKEALSISRALLEKKLVACVKISPVSSLYRWQDEIKTNEEILLIMDSERSLFDKVDQEVRKLHSYKVFTLVSLPVERTTIAVKQWLGKELIAY